MIHNKAKCQDVFIMKARFTKYALQQQVIKDNFQQGDSYEQYQYFYHPDHLGSSSFITNTEGEVVQHIEYVPDSAVMEQVRRPLRTLYDQKGDCDCYATLIGSILTNLGIPFSLRIAKYNGRSYFQHVYVVVREGDKELVVDPVVDKCFYEKKPSEKKDFPN